jgi:hypothetical protein
MKKIEAYPYQLSNGELVEDFETAEKKERMIQFKTAVTDFANKYGYYEFRKNLESTLLENRDELKKIFRLLD